MNDLILTVDTGGSKTKITLFDTQGNELAAATGAGVGVAHTETVALSHLNEELRSLLGNRPFSAVETVAINVGGTNAEQIKQAFAALFPHAAVEAHRESSGVIMSALCDAEGADALLMAGTGAIALCKGPDGGIITDGWCPNVGDLGSGYWIGLEAIRRSVMALEGDKPLSPLVKQITGLDEPFAAFEDTACQMALRDRVRAHFMPLERARVAALTRLAAACAREGDKTAQGIFCEAGRHLANTLLRGLHLTHAPEGARILVSGGLVNCFDLWGTAFEAALAGADKHYTYRIGNADMTKGALYYAQHHMKRRI